jgi:hypothetical protein
MAKWNAGDLAYYAFSPVVTAIGSGGVTSILTGNDALGLAVAAGVYAKTLHECYKKPTNPPREP